MKFPCISGDINVLTKTALHYKTLGHFLLNSSDGVEVLVVENKHQGNPKDIILDMFQTWLQRDETASWKVLVGYLRSVELNSLAKDIEDTLHK